MSYEVVMNRHREIISRNSPKNKFKVTGTVISKFKFTFFGDIDSELTENLTINFSPKDI